MLEGSGCYHRCHSVLNLSPRECLRRYRGVEQRLPVILAEIRLQSVKQDVRVHRNAAGNAPSRRRWSSVAAVSTMYRRMREFVSSAIEAKSTGGLASSNSVRVQATTTRGISNCPVTYRRRRRASSKILGGVVGWIRFVGSGNAEASGPHPDAVAQAPKGFNARHRYPGKARVQRCQEGPPSRMRQWYFRRTIDPEPPLNSARHGGNVKRTAHRTAWRTCI